MNVKCIGIGAAGNKAAITLVEKKVLAQDNVLLINSTLKDIPADYKGLAVEYVNSYGGCGKERKNAYDLAVNSIKAGKIPLDDFLNIGKSNEAELVIIVTSTEGGTGSGSSIIIGKYIKSHYDIDVHMFGFVGFKTDPRGLKNTVEWFSELQEDFAVEAVENSKYLPECRGNKIKAEKMANEDFANKVGILIGNTIRYSEHNIDPTDLLKVSAKQTGFMVIESANFEKIKNKEQFEAMVVRMIDDSKSVDVSNVNAKKSAVFLNISPASTDFISYEEIITERYGERYENYEHIQHEADMPEFFAIIIAGMKMPVEEIQRVYTEYKDRMGQVDRSGDDFFASVSALSFDDDDDQPNKLKNKNTNSDDQNFANPEKPAHSPSASTKVVRPSAEGSESSGKFSNVRVEKADIAKEY